MRIALNISKTMINLTVTTGILLGSITATMAQNASIAIGSGTGIPGSGVSVPMTLTTSGGVKPSSLQWTMAYSSDISNVVVAAAANATNAGKSVTCSSTSGKTTCVVYGMNSNLLSDGLFASVTLTVASGTVSPSTTILVNGAVSDDLSGGAIPAIGTAGIISITQLTSLTCTPLTLGPGSVSTCTVNLSAPALTGFAVGLASGNPLVTVPPSVSIPVGASSASFSASVASTVPSAQTATLSASAGGAAKAVSLSLTASAWSISGGLGAAGSGATVALTGSSTAGTTADGSGNYTFNGLANGSYTISPSKNGYTFSPASKAVTVNGANVTGVTFTAAVQTWSISGALGAAGSGATVALSGSKTASTIADGSGNYTFTALANGSYTVTPTKSGYSFSPASLAVTVNGANITGTNFTAAAQTWGISGGLGTSGSGATVALTGASTASVTADASGNYTFTGLANGSYTVTPTKNGFAFSPTSLAVTVNGANVTGVNFTVLAIPTTITVDATASYDRSTSSGTITVPSIKTVSGNELLLAFVSTGYRSGKSTNAQVSAVSGGGLTWVLVMRTHAQRGTAEIWRAFTTVPLTGASVIVTLSQSVPASITVMSFAGVNTAGTNGSGAIGATGTASATSGAPQASLVSTSSNSLVIGVGNDTDSAKSRTVGAGQTMVHQYLTTTTDTYWVQRVINQTAPRGTTVSISDSAPVNDRYNLSIVEILPSPTSGAQVTGLKTPAAAEPAVSKPRPGVAPAAAASLALAKVMTGEVGDACSPGGLASLLGTGLTGRAAERPTSFPLPATLGGVQVLVNGLAAPLMLVSDAQVNFQCPMLAEGSKLQIRLESESGAYAAPVETIMQAAVPVVFQFDAGKRGLVTIAGSDEIAMEKTEGIASRPAKHGEVLTIFASGLGEVVDGVPTGIAAPVDRPVRLARKIVVVAGDVEIEPLFAGLEPGTVGLYQVRAQLSADIAKGNSVPVYLKMTLPDGTTVASNTVTIAVTTPASSGLAQLP